MMIKPLFIRERSNVTALKQPKEIGRYSRKSYKENVENESVKQNCSTAGYKSKYYINDDIFLNYYYLPNDDLDKRIINLSGGFNKFKNASPVDDLSLHGLLATLIDIESKKNKKSKVDVVTMRGIIKSLIMLFNSLGSRNTTASSTDVDLQVVTFDGQIFIKKAGSLNSQHQETQEKPSTNESLTRPVGSRFSNTTRESQYLKKCEYSGYKFETCATLPRPVSEIPREKLDKRYKKIGTNDEQYNILVKTGIGNCKMILGAEVDAVFDFKEESQKIGEVPENLKHYLELKTSKMITNAHQAKTFENKLFNAWLQCFLVGVPRITYGFRDDDFNLVAVEEFLTNEIPVNLKNMNSLVSNHFGDSIKWYGAVVEWLLKNVEYKEGQENYYRLFYQDNYLKLEKIPDFDTEKVVEYKNVISDEFRKWRLSLQH
ncbi:hypothetical protein ACO0RG_000390 [Hanseniaspora osmophila]